MSAVGEEILIREWRIEDTDGICEIYRLLTGAPVTDDFKRKVQGSARSSASGVHLVAVSEGKIVGFIISYILPFGFGAEDRAYISTMGVHPRVMGRGIGVKMTKNLFSYYKKHNISIVYTSVKWSSTDLLSFFKTLGFDSSNYLNLKLDLEPPDELITGGI